MRAIYGLLVGFLLACSSSGSDGSGASGASGDPGEGGAIASAGSAGMGGASSSGNGGTPSGDGGKAASAGAAGTSGAGGAKGGSAGSGGSAGHAGSSADGGASEGGSDAGMRCPLPVKAAPLKIACVGDSITQGNGATDQGKKGYPGQLADLLGSGFKVGNFGHSGASLTGGSYAGTAEYTGAQSFAPDVVVIMLGTNDINVFAFPKIGDFVADYLKMIAVFRALPSHPVVFLGLPPWVKMDDVNYGYTEARLTTEILPRIRQVAETSSACLIDIHAVTLNHPEYYFDNLHPNDTGYGVLAQTVQHSLE